MSLITASTLTLGFGLPGHGEWIVLLILGLLIFGRRLPEVGRSLGRGIVEFKRGIRGVEDEIEEASSGPATRPERLTEKSVEDLEAERRADKVASVAEPEKDAAG